MKLHQLNALLTSIGFTLAFWLLFRAVGLVVKVRERLRCAK